MNKNQIKIYILAAVFVIALLAIRYTGLIPSPAGSPTAAMDADTSDISTTDTPTSVAPATDPGTSVTPATDPGTSVAPATDPGTSVAPATDPGTPEQSTTYSFRTPELRLSHFTKHGIDMGFTTEEAYEEAASRVITNPRALHKTEAEDGDDVYYVEDTNEFVVLSTDGYIRTYFCPDRGKAYFDRQ